MLLLRDSDRRRRSAVQQISCALQCQQHSRISGDGLDFINQRHALIDVFRRQASRVGRGVEMLVAEDNVRGTARGLFPGRQ